MTFYIEPAEIAELRKVAARLREPVFLTIKDHVRLAKSIDDQCDAAERHPVRGRT